MKEELDNELKDLAKNDWDKFIILMGPESVTVAKMRLLKKKGKSYRQISLKLTVTESQVRYACNKKIG